MTTTPAGSPPPKLNEVGALHALAYAIRSRILSGLIAALPIVLTFWIIYWLYATLNRVILLPVIAGVQYVMFGDQGQTNTVLDRYVSPVIAVALVLFFLYCLGLFVRSRMHRAVDWVLLHVPVVTTIYKALSNVFQSLDNQLHGSRFNRVVLVEFPHPGSRALAFVTNSLRDATTDRTILCVCVLTGVMPPAGFTLFVPEDQVTDVDWSANQALQAILSGGITAPASVHYVQGLRVPTTGPIVDPQGHPIEPARDTTGSGV